MAKGVRRTIEQLIEDKRKELADLEAKAKAKPALTIDDKSMTTIVNGIKKVATANGLTHKAVIKILSDGMVPKTVRVKKS